MPRIDTSATLYTHVRHLPTDERVIVPPKDVQVAYWETRGPSKYIATGFMNTAWAVVIVSKEAGMIAHQPAVSIDHGYPTPFGTANFSHDRDEELLSRLKKLFESNRGKFEDCKVWVISGCLEDGESTAKHCTSEIFAALRALRLGSDKKGYQVFLPADLPNTGYASIVVDATQSGVVPKVILNDKVLTPTSAQDLVD